MAGKKHNTQIKLKLNRNMSKDLQKIDHIQEKPIKLIQKNSKMTYKLKKEINFRQVIIKSMVKTEEIEEENKIN